MADKQKGLLEKKKKKNKAKEPNKSSSEALPWVIECSAVID